MCKGKYFNFNVHLEVIGAFLVALTNNLKVMHECKYQIKTTANNTVKLNFFFRKFNFFLDYLPAKWAQVH